jgi:hypothetical protein
VNFLIKAHNQIQEESKKEMIVEKLAKEGTEV